MIRRRYRRATDPTPEPTDDQIIARLRSLEAAATSSGRDTSRAAVWARVVADHPALGTTHPATGRPTALRASRPVGWRRMFDVAAVAAIVVLLLFGLQGVSFLSDAPGSVPLGTQSVAAATPTGTAPASMTDDQVGSAQMIAATPPGSGIQFRIERERFAVGTTPP